MQCEEIQNLLPDFDDDLLNPVTRYAIENHLKTCEECNKELIEIRMLFQTISDNSLEQPDKPMKDRFLYMLGEEIRNLEKENKRRKNLAGRIISLPWVRYSWPVAAAVFIFFTGIFFGNRWRPGNESGASAQIRELKGEVKEVKEMLMFNLLKEESASDRIKAVNYVDELPDPDQKILHMLINTLNNDKNVNVRLASLYSLAKFMDLQLVRDSLVSSLKIQTEPVIQVVMINLLAEKKERKAIKPIEDIISNRKTLKEVKQIALQGLKSI
jgi:hypothetical protein